MKADLHVHTEYSPCSKTKIKDVLIAAVKAGLDTIAVTDHNTIKGALLTKKLSKDVKVIIGCEKKCEYGELLIYGLKKEIKSKKFTGIIKEARKQGAKIFISHPIDYARFPNMWKKLNDEVFKLVDGVELYNGRNLFNKRVKRIAENKKLAGVAGSDAHYSEELGNTYVIYKKDLWKEVISNKASYYHNNNVLNKLKYLLKSFLLKWF
ncbi:MAG: PHP domain-containing protein [Nanoarchaeota archaeon]|nr:PHP domain-containing protein [Nanoarchaeota archaeon]